MVASRWSAEADRSSLQDWTLWLDTVLSETNAMLRDPDGEIVLWSEGAARLYGWPARDAVGCKAQDLLRTRFHPDSLDAILVTLRRDGRWQGELHQRRRDGALLTVASHWLLTDSPGGTRVIEFSHDITRFAEARRAQAKLAAIVASSSDAIVGKTLDGIVTSWNGAAERILGWPAADMIGRSIAAVVPSERLGEENEILTRIRAGGRVEHFETVRVRRDGAMIPVSLSISPIHDEHGAIIGASKILRDDTERRAAQAALRDANAQLEQRVAERTSELAGQMEARRKIEAALAQSQKMEAVGQLTGGVAHDFNNLLTVITGNLDFIAGLTDGNDRLRRLVASSQRAVSRGARLTAQLLAFARRQVLMPEIVRLDTVMRDFSGLVRRAVGETVEVVLQGSPGLWPCEVDPAQLESAVLNLAINARDAMPEGGRLTLTLRNVAGHRRREQAPGRFVSITVTDSGTGMTDEIAARAVEPFFTTKEIGKGSGLGLSQVYGFVEQSGGTLSISSRPGEGTSVSLLFPALATVAPADVVLDTEDLTMVVAGTTVLVVEDDPDVRELVEETLRGDGHDVLTARDGREALVLLENHPALQIVVSDVVMPNGTSGVELAREARRRRPDIRVLLISGYPRDELNRLGGTGTFPFLPKPFRPADLTARMYQLMHADA